MVCGGQGWQSRFHLRPQSVNNSASLGKSAVDKLECFGMVFAQNKGHAPARYESPSPIGFDDCNHSFERDPGVLLFVTNPQMPSDPFFCLKQ